VLPLGRPEDIPAEADLIAGAPGYEPCVQRACGAFVRENHPYPPPVTLVLGRPTLSISGTVVDVEGNSLFAYVAVVDKTLLAEGAYAEDLARARSDELRPDEFVVSGLFPRRYTLAVTCLEFRTKRFFEGIQAGSTDVVLTLEPGPRWRRVSGTVRGPDGAALGGIIVSLLF
jgi:hypothetical protein